MKFQKLTLQNIKHDMSLNKIYMDHGLFTSANVPSSASADSEKTMYIGRDAPNENYGVHTGN